LSSRRRVKTLTFSYFDGTDWQDSWDGTQLGSDGMTPVGAPLAIAITIGIAPPGSGTGSGNRGQTENLPPRGRDPDGELRAGAGHGHHDAVTLCLYALLTAPCPAARASSSSRSWSLVVILTLTAYQFSELMLREYKAAGVTCAWPRRGPPPKSGIHYAAALLSSPDSFHQHPQQQPVRQRPGFPGSAGPRRQ